MESRSSRGSEFEQADDAKNIFDNPFLEDVDEVIAWIALMA